MPIINSAKKRVKITKKATVRNAKTKRSLKTAIKAFHSAVAGGKKDARKLESKAASTLDKAAKKGVMHKNKVARKKSQLSRAGKAAGVSKTAKLPAKKTAKKAAPKKSSAKKK